MEKITFAEVMGICQVNSSALKPRGAEVYFPCPKCGKLKASYNEAKGVASCFYCHDGWNPVTLWQAYTGNRDDFPTAKRQLLHLLGHGGHTPIMLPKYVEHEEPIAPIVQRDKVYKCLFQILTLDDRHKQDLLSRGIEKGPFRTLDIKSDEEGKALCAKLIKMGCNLRNVPPFYFDSADGYWHMALPKKGLRGILVPYYDVEGRIQGLQLRKDEELRRTFKNGDKEPKYTWLSARRAPESARYASAAKTFVGMMCSFRVGQDGKKHPVLQNGTIYLTEGAMKAFIAHDASGLPFMAVPGVNSIRFLRKTLVELKERYGLRRVVQAYDMDYLVNPNVQSAVEKTEKIIRDLGLDYTRWTWNDLKVTLPDGTTRTGILKGIDDACVYYYRGVLPRELVS